MINLLHGDCFSYFNSFKDKQFDLSITSPPYNMNLRIRNGKHCSRQVVKEITTKYENFSDNLPMPEYRDFLIKLTVNMLRVSKMAIINIQPLTGNKRALFEWVASFSGNIKEVVIWDKVNSQPSISLNTLNSKFEFIFFLTEKDDAISRRFKKAFFQKGCLENVWTIKKERSKNNKHKATFPESLVETILNNFSKVGDSVLDPMMGTGTVGAACKRLGRDFTGVEIDKDYFDFSKQRIEAVNPLE